MSAGRHPHRPCGLIVVVMSLLVLGATHTQPVTASAQVPIVLFTSETCGECLEVSAWLDGLIASGTRIDIRRFSADNVTSAPLRHLLDVAYGVPEEQRYLVPAVFIGRTALIRGDVIEAGLPQLVRTATSRDNQFLLQQITTSSSMTIVQHRAIEPWILTLLFAVLSLLVLLGGLWRFDWK